jgi:hypothetical protein
MPFPSKRTAEVEQEILERLSQGEPLAEICRSDPKFPHPTTWNDWCAADEALGIAHGRARDAGFDAIAADILRIADTPEEGVETTIKSDGATEERRADMLGHRKLRIETRLKLLAKWDPRRYGEKVETTHRGNVTLATTPIDEEL